MDLFWIMDRHSNVASSERRNGCDHGKKAIFQARNSEQMNRVLQIDNFHLKYRRPIVRVTWLGLDSNDLNLESWLIKDEYLKSVAGHVKHFFLSNYDKLRLYHQPIDCSKQPKFVLCQKKRAMLEATQGQTSGIFKTCLVQQFIVK